MAADTLLATSSSSVGEVLTQSGVQALPTVGNNVMDLYRLIPGVTVKDNGVRGSFAGLEGFGTTNIQRDGVDAAGGARWTANALTATHMSPDLIGELKVVVAPVDAELGRGNAQIQFLTRSGTNRFRGTAVLECAKQRARRQHMEQQQRPSTPKRGNGPHSAGLAQRPQFTVASFGGPIVRNKTFFFALYDQALVNVRTTQNPIVLTPCARNGIFRYFDSWNNGNALQVRLSRDATPTIAVVDGVGNPLRPATNPTGSRRSQASCAMRASSVL